MQLLCLVKIFLQAIQWENNTQITRILCPLFGHYSRFYTLETYLKNDTEFGNISHVTYVTQRLLLSTCEYVSYTEACSLSTILLTYTLLHFAELG